jgi:hypothetical protein
VPVSQGCCGAACCLGVWLGLLGAWGCATAARGSCSGGGVVEPSDMSFRNEPTGPVEGCGVVAGMHNGSTDTASTSSLRVCSLCAALFPEPLGQPVRYKVGSIHKPHHCDALHM